MQEDTDPIDDATNAIKKGGNPLVERFITSAPKETPIIADRVNRTKTWNIPPQCEKPGLMSPQLQMLQAQLDNFVQVEYNPNDAGCQIPVKCQIKTGRWHKMDSDALISGVHLMERTLQQEELFLVMVKFCSGSLVVESDGASRSALCGWAIGSILYGEYVIPAKSDTYFVKYNNKENCFEVDGHRVIEAEALVLLDKCQAQVIGPKFG